MTEETSAQIIKNQLKSRFGNEKIEELKKKPMHGQFHQELERISLDIENLWFSYLVQTDRDERRIK
jgi:hypothetical protein